MADEAQREQLSLEEWAAAHPVVPPLRSVYDDAPPRHRSIDASFRAFHAANPHIYAELAKMARRAKGRGVERIGIKTLWEVLRWRIWETARPNEEPYRLNNNFPSRYVRLLDQEPDLHGLFEMREIRAR